MHPGKPRAGVRLTRFFRRWFGSDDEEGKEPALRVVGHVRPGETEVRAPPREPDPPR